MNESTSFISESASPMPGSLGQGKNEPAGVEPQWSSGGLSVTWDATL